MNGRSITILFSSAGRRVELIECFRADAAELGLSLRVLAADVNPTWSAACHQADYASAVPPCTSADFIPAMLELCQREQVHLIIPTIDPELNKLAAHVSLFRSVGTQVAISAPAIVDLARHKLETARVLARHGVPTPRSAPVAELLANPDQWRWPVLLKPANGSSSVGVFQVETPERAQAVSAADSEYIAQELLTGREYTVNVFFSAEGDLKCAVPHWRCQVRAGEVSKAVTERHAGLMEIAQRLGKVLVGARGALCFQAIVTAQDLPVVFEINARFGGGFPLAHRAGARFSKWLLEEALGLPCSGQTSWQDGLAMLRYDRACFFPKGTTL